MTIIANDGFVIICEAAFAAQLKVLARHLPDTNEEEHEARELRQPTSRQRVEPVRSVI